MATLGEQAVGSIVKLNVSGTATNFIVLHQGLPGTMYDSSCDGTWLLMEKLAKGMEFRTSSATGNDYSKSQPHTYCNGDFINQFDAAVKSAIKQVKIPYRPGSGNGTTVSSGSKGLSTKAFCLSAMEAGGANDSQYPIDGCVLSYFVNATNSKRIAYYGSRAYRWYFRTPSLSMANASGAYQNGSIGGLGTSNDSFYVRPAMILLPELIVSSGGLIDGTVASSGAITGTVIINGVRRELTGKGYINIGGVLRDLSDSQVNIGSTLKSLKG